MAVQSTLYNEKLFPNENIERKNNRQNLGNEKNPLKQEIKYSPLYQAYNTPNVTFEN